MEHLKYEEKIKVNKKNIIQLQMFNYLCIYIFIFLFCTYIYMYVYILHVCI